MLPLLVLLLLQLPTASPAASSVVDNVGWWAPAGHGTPPTRVAEDVVVVVVVEAPHRASSDSCVR